MKFNCEKCGTRYTIADAKVHKKVLKIRCKVCEHIIEVRDPEVPLTPTAPEPAPPTTTPAQAPVAQRGTPSDPLGPLAEVEWYAAIDGRQDGPMPLERLRDLIRRGHVRGDDVVWNERMADWAPVAEVPALADALRPKAPPPLPPPPRRAPPAPPAPPAGALPESVDLDALLAPPARVQAPAEPAPPPPAAEAPAEPEPPTERSAPPVPAHAPPAREEEDEPTQAWPMTFGEDPLVTPPAPEPAPKVVEPAAPARTPKAAPVESAAANSMLRSFGLEDAQLDAEHTEAHPAVLAAALPAPQRRWGRAAGIAAGGGAVIAIALIAGFLLAPDGQTAVSPSADAAAPVAAAPPDAAPVVAAQPDAAVAIAPPVDATVAAAPAPDAAPVVAAPAPEPARPVKRAEARPSRPAAAKTEPEAAKEPDRPSAFASLDQGRTQVDVATPVPTGAEEDLPDTLTQAQIAGTIREYQRGIRSCYDRQLKRDDSLRSGRATLAFKILPSGRTSDVQLEKRYDGTVLQSCLEGMVKRWRFPRFKGSPIEVEYPLIFSASM